MAAFSMFCQGSTILPCHQQNLHLHLLFPFFAVGDGTQIKQIFKIKMDF